MDAHERRGGIPTGLTGSSGLSCLSCYPVKIFVSSSRGIQGFVFFVLFVVKEVSLLTNKGTARCSPSRRPIDKKAIILYNPVKKIHFY